MSRICEFDTQHGREAFNHAWADYYDAHNEVIDIEDREAAWDFYCALKQTVLPDEAGRRMAADAIRDRRMMEAEALGEDR